MFLEDVGFSWSSGERVAIAGRNGSGKTGLLRAVAGIVSPSEGELHVEGTVALVEPPTSLVWLTPSVDEELRFARACAGKDGTFSPAWSWVIDAFALHDLLRRDPMTLSGAEQQRVHLAAAFAIEPRILLLDEPDVYLDPPGARRLDALLATTQGAVDLIVRVTHRVLVLRAASRVMVFAGGRVAADGDPATVLGDERSGAWGIEIPTPAGRWT